MRVFVPSAADLLTNHVAHGEALIAWSLLDGLAARGHELVVCASRVELDGDAPFDVVRIDRGARESLAPIRYARAAERELQRRGPFDIVHWLFPQDARSAIFTPPRDVPYVIGPHFAPWPARRRPLSAGDAVRVATAPLTAARRRRALAGAHALLAATPDALPEAKGKVRLTPPGTELPAATTPPGARRVLFVGRLDAEKNVGALLDAFGSVRRAHADAELVLAGPGEIRAPDGVRVLGAVPHADVQQLIADCDVFCLPSVGEPYGMALLEAMAAGRPVVAGPGPGPSFLVTPDGGRIASGDELAGALVELLGDDALARRMGEANRARVERELTLDRFVASVEAVYEEIAR